MLASAYFSLSYLELRSASSMSQSELRLKDDPIFKILTRFNKITIVGLSPDPTRPSYQVAQYLIQAGYDVNGVRPNTQSILDRPCFPTLAHVPGPLEIVVVFRSSEHIPALVLELLVVRAKVLWLQEGISHPESEKKARSSGIFVISNRCIKKEHQRIKSTGVGQAS
jgi:predicted CoA-binding protein